MRILPQATEVAKAPPRVSEFKRFRRVFFSRPVVLAGSFTLLVLIGMAILAPLISPYDPYDQDLGQTLQQSSREHILGSDQLGRDVLSRVIYGSRISLLIGIIAVSIAAVFGLTLGLLAGYSSSSWLNQLIMRFTDALLAIPPLMLALVFATVLGGGLMNIMIAIGISMTPTYCRLMYGEVLSIKESDYILAARVTGASNLRIMLFHLLPNAFPTLIVLITLNMGDAILTESSLSFLGIGIAPPEAAWGAMVRDGYYYLLANPLFSLAPGLCILLVVLSFNMIGDGIRDALDPRLRGKI